MRFCGALRPGYAGAWRRAFAAPWFEFDDAARFIELLDAGSQFAIQRLQALFSFTAIGKILRDFCETIESPVGFAKRGDGNRGPECGTIFLDAEAFVAESAFLFGESEFAFGPMALDRFCRIEDGEMLADDFLARCNP